MSSGRRSKYDHFQRILSAMPRELAAELRFYCPEEATDVNESFVSEDQVRDCFRLNLTVNFASKMRFL